MMKRLGFKLLAQNEHLADRVSSRRAEVEGKMVYLVFGEEFGGRWLTFKRGF